jgi:hypothetical protein
MSYCDEEPEFVYFVLIEDNVGITAEDPAFDT